MTTPEPRGTVTTIDGEPNLVINRELDAPREEVWRDFTESDRLEKWIGRWEGDPASGHISFYMTAESESIPAEEYTILECDRPRRFAGDTSMASGAWHLWFELAESGGVTTVTFGQRLNPGEDVGSIGPGWEYYLDRMIAVREGRDAATVVWDDYFPALQAHYQRLAAD